MGSTPSAVDSDRLDHWHRHGFDRVVVATDRFVAMAGALGPDQLAAPVPGLEWRAGEVIAHVASVYRRYTVNPARAASAAEVAGQNAADLEAGATDVDDLVEEMLTQLSAMEATVGLLAPSTTVPFHAGQPITLAGAWGNLLGELLAHGDDVARAAGIEWEFESADLEPLWRYATRVLSGWFTVAGRTSTEAFHLDLGFDSGPVTIRFTGGGLVVDEPDPPPSDHRVAGDAATLTLAMPYRRRATSDPGLLALGALLEPF